MRVTAASSTTNAAGIPARALPPLKVLLVVLCLFLPLLFLVTALRRMHFPYELEQLEGNMFFAGLRAYQHQPIYQQPSLRFIPYMYPPGYYWTAAWLGHLTGHFTIATLRLTSILSTLGCFGALYALVWGELRRHLPALVAMGLYAGCYVLCGEWFDLARLDSLFILLMLLGLLASRWTHPVLAALVWVACFQTKQSILPVAILVLCHNYRDRWRTAAGLLTLAVAAGGSVLWLNHLSGGWYSFYVFRVPAANADIQRRMLTLFPMLDLLRPLALATALVVAALLLTPPSLRSRATRFWISACSIVPLFWWIAAHAGSTVNTPMPIYALLAALFGIAFGRLFVSIEENPAAWPRAAMLLLLLCTLGQEAAGIFNPGDYLPRPF